MSRTKQPYFAVDPRWWPGIAEALSASGAPWPEEAILADLRWWEDQVFVERELKVPGRRALAKRWNHNPNSRALRALLRSEAWKEGAGVSNQGVTRSRPAGDPLVTRLRPGSDIENADEQGATDPPLTRSRPAADPPVTTRAEKTPPHLHTSTPVSDSPKPPQPPAEGAQGQLDLVGPDQALAQVEGMLQRLGVAERVKPDAREGLRDQELLSEAQLAALSPKALRAVPGVGGATAKRLRSALVRAGFTPAEEPTKDTRAARLVGGTWAGLWEQRTDTKYVWRWKRQGKVASDEEHADGLAGLVGVEPEGGRQQEPLHRLHRAMRAYLEACDRDDVFPREPPTFERFAEKVQQWLQVGDGLVDGQRADASRRGFTDMQDEARRYREEMLRGGSVTPIPALKVVT